MKRRLRWWFLPVMALLVGCSGDPAEPSNSGPRTPDTPPADRSGLDVEQQERFTAAKEAQAAALDSTRDLVSAAPSASLGELEEGLRTLNDALVHARTEVGRLRSEKPSGYKELMAELRTMNREIQKAYDTLLAHHPNPTPETLGPSGD